VSIKGSAYANFRRALESGNLTRVRSAAAELPSVDLTDALAVCRLMRDEEPGAYEAAALRWLARLCSERAVSLEDMLEAAVALRRLEEAPGAADALLALAQRPRRAGRRFNL
jgi:hypothetical protein